MFDLGLLSKFFNFGWFDVNIDEYERFYFGFELKGSIYLMYREGSKDPVFKNWSTATNVDDGGFITSSEKEWEQEQKALQIFEEVPIYFRLYTFEELYGKLEEFDEMS